MECVFWNSTVLMSISYVQFGSRPVSTSQPEQILRKRDSRPKFVHFIIVHQCCRSPFVVRSMQPADGCRDVLMKIDLLTTHPTINLFVAAVKDFFSRRKVFARNSDSEQTILKEIWTNVSFVEPTIMSFRSDFRGSRFRFDSSISEEESPAVRAAEEALKKADEALKKVMDDGIAVSWMIAEMAGQRQVTALGSRYGKKFIDVIRDPHACNDGTRTQDYLMELEHRARSASGIKHPSLKALLDYHLKASAKLPWEEHDLSEGNNSKGDRQKFKGLIERLNAVKGERNAAIADKEKARELLQNTRTGYHYADVLRAAQKLYDAVDRQVSSRR